MATPNGGTDSVSSRAPRTPPRVLGVIAHPDDESIFASAAYRIVRELGGVFTLVVVTNGEAGFRYATLAEALYERPLTQEPMGRHLLPAIRQAEMRAAGQIIGVSDYHFLDLKDTAYGTDPAPLFAGDWDCDDLKARLIEIIDRAQVDFVFAMLPDRAEHAHHQVCGIMTVEAVAAISPERRPVVLSAHEYAAGLRPRFDGVEGRPATRVALDAPILELDRRARLGRDGALSYQIVASWILAAHKTQGLAQTRMGTCDTEGFWSYAINGPAGDARTRALFARLEARA